MQTFAIDSVELERCDLIKMDIEGMELEALEGARATIERHKPLLFVECVKVDTERLQQMLIDLGYRFFPHGMSLLAGHESDKTLAHVETGQKEAA